MASRAGALGAEALVAAGPFALRRDDDAGAGMANGDNHICGGNRRPIQLAKVKTIGWTKARRTKFLKVLAETCNVSMAVRASGSSGSPYGLRRRDPAFAQLWDEALAIGYDRLETMLLQRAIEGVNDIDVGQLAADSEREAAAAMPAGAAEDAGGDAESDAAAGAAGLGLVPAFARKGVARSDVQLALTLLSRRRDGGIRSTRTRKVMSVEEVDALLLKKLDALARKLRRPRD